jgi:hypothetical protein
MTNLGKDEHTAAYWRERAEQARGLGWRARGRRGQGTLENIARMYDSMAKLAELSKARSDS